MADVLVGIFWRHQADVFSVAGTDQFGGSAAAHGDDAAQLFHNADVIQVFVPLQRPTHILKTAGHVFLAVQIVGAVIMLSQFRHGIVQHGRYFVRPGDPLLFLRDPGAFFSGEGMDSDVFRPKIQNRVHRGLESGG